MASNGIDASLGLSPALDLLMQQQDTGELQCIISTTHMFKTKREKAVIQIRNGQVISCMIIDESNKTLPTSISALIRLDEKCGSLEWKFFPYHGAPSSAPRQLASMPTLPMPTIPQHTPVVANQVGREGEAIPERLFPELHLDWLKSLPAEQISMLQGFWPFINGKRSVRELKSLLRIRFSPETVERMLMFLIAMHHITIRRKKRTNS